MSDPRLPELGQSYEENAKRFAVLLGQIHQGLASPLPTTGGGGGGSVSWDDLTDSQARTARSGLRVSNPLVFAWGGDDGSDPEHGFFTVNNSDPGSTSQIKLSTFAKHANAIDLGTYLPNFSVGVGTWVLKLLNLRTDRTAVYDITSLTLGTECAVFTVVPRAPDQGGWYDDTDGDYCFSIEPFMLPVGGGSALLRSNTQIQGWEVLPASPAEMHVQLPHYEDWGAWQGTLTLHVKADDDTERDFVVAFSQADPGTADHWIDIDGATGEAVTYETELAAGLASYLNAQTDWQLATALGTAGDIAISTAFKGAQASLSATWSSVDDADAVITGGGIGTAGTSTYSQEAEILAAVVSKTPRPLRIALVNTGSTVYTVEVSLKLGGVYYSLSDNITLSDPAPVLVKPDTWEQEVRFSGISDMPGASLIARVIDPEGMGATSDYINVTAIVEQS